jgi:taurine dioxygenase
MVTIEPTGAVLGATVRGIDLAKPLSEQDMAKILLALGRHGVLRFPEHISTLEL